MSGSPDVRTCRARRSGLRPVRRRAATIRVAKGRRGLGPGRSLALGRSPRSSSVQIDIAVDSPKQLPSVKSPAGPTLAPVELAALKLLALFDRAQPRDFVDVYALAARFGKERVFEWVRLCWSDVDLSGSVGALEHERGGSARRQGADCRSPHPSGTRRLRIVTHGARGWTPGVPIRRARPASATTRPRCLWDMRTGTFP